MSRISVPVLLEDRSRFDWHRAEYEPAIRVAPTHATIEHRLHRAPTLQRLVDKGIAKWAAELRCPKTLYCRVEEATHANQVVDWSRDDVDGDMFVIPGLVAATDLVLEPERDELTPIWLAISYDVPKGRWLARGVARRTRTLGQSLLTFREDDNLPTGQMQILRDQSAEDLHFHVRIAKDIWPERTNRHVQIAALTGALGQMVGAFSESDDEPAVAQEIRRRLEEAGIPVWDDPERYDPARAATVIEPFRSAAADSPRDPRH